MALSASRGTWDGASALSARRLAAGDRAEFDRLVRLNEERVARLVARLLGWPADVDDVVQDVFVSALNSITRFQHRSSVETWLTRIAINACRSHRRRRLLRLKTWRAAVERRPVEVPATCERASGSDETSRLVRESVRRLPVRYREVVVLRYLEELPAAEVAVLLGLTPNAVEVRLNRARARLKAALGDKVRD